MGGRALGGDRRPVPPWEWWKRGRWGARGVPSSQIIGAAKAEHVRFEDGPICLKLTPLLLRGFHEK